MSTGRAGNLLWGLAAAGLAVLALVLLYAFVVRSLFPAPEVVQPADDGEPTGEIIQVEVRNGCGEAGVAETLTRFLRQNGFDVVEVGNHSSFDVAETHVIDRVGAPETARRVAEALGVAEDQIREEIRPAYFLDATIVIGKDYATLPAFAED